MRARILFFGMLREIAGSGSEEAEFPQGTDLAGVFRAYAARFPRFQELAGSIVVARNQEFADPATPVGDGDEIAFLPPVSGGIAHDPLEIRGTKTYCALTRHAIDTRVLVGHLLSGREGAVITFEGTVRNNTKGRPTLYLDYECYESMALKMMDQIARELAASDTICQVAMVHRLGRMLIGEASVAIIVMAPHRRAAFEVALEGINRLKKVVPIWKKEHFADGEVWVEGEWGDHVPVAG
jgi:molybdopterin synthase catalytic subunit